MSVLVVDIEHRFERGPGVRAAFRADLAASPVTVLFGPSGAGKTTVLRAIAGLLTPATGAIALEGIGGEARESWFDARARVNVTPQRRRAVYTPQDQALFPHLSVAGNIGYGLASLGAAEREARVSELVRACALDRLEHRRPADISGGQKQRVALARALAVRPRLLLLDEPLSSLDESGRERLGAEVRAMLIGAGIPAIIVTHDRREALALGDHAVVMIEGLVRQSGPIAEVFSRPADEGVARAVGTETIVAGTVTAKEGAVLTVRVGWRKEHPEKVVLIAAAGTAEGAVAIAVGAEVLLCIRASDVTLHHERAERTSVRNTFLGTVASVREGDGVLSVRVDCGFMLAALITRSAAAELGIAPGAGVHASVKATAIHVVPR